MRDTAISAMPAESDVFISYATDTRPLAEQLTQSLQEQGFHVWVDFQNLRPGQPWQIEIEQALERARSFLILVSPKSRASAWQENEWRAALVKVWSDSDKRLIPVVVGGNEPPAFLRNWVWLRVDPAAEPGTWTRHVVDVLQSASNGAVKAPSAGDRQEWRQRLDEIRLAAEELGRTEPEHEHLPPGSRS